MKTMKTFFDVLAGVGCVAVVVIFVLLLIFNPRHSWEKTEIASIRAQIAENAIEIQEIEQGCWDIQRDLYYLVVKAWVIDTIRHHSNFEFSLATGNLDLSPVNNWFSLFDAWKPWLQNKKSIPSTVI